MKTKKEKTKVTLKGRLDLTARRLRVQYKNRIYELPIIAFQKSLGEQEQDIPCIIERYSDREISIRQNIGALLKKHYNVGARVLFKVKDDYSDYYVVEDEYGFVGYLHKKDLPKSHRLYRGQGIYCRITYFTDDFPVLLPIAFSSGSFGEAEVSKILKDATWEVQPFIQILLATDGNSSNETLIHEWILSLISNGSSLDTVRTDICDLLELSPLLNQCDDEERKLFQNRLTQIIDFLHYYTKAYSLISTPEEGIPELDRAKDFVEGIIEKIKRSGFVYHPETNLGVMMAIFRLENTLMLEAIPKLIESVCLRGEACKREPFRSVLIQLLELYIQYVDQRLSLSSDLEGLVTTLIQALAIQLLLATEKDTHLINYSINQSKLYRYVSRSSQVKMRHTIDLAYMSLIGLGNLPAYSFDRILDPKGLIGLFSNYGIGEESVDKIALSKELGYEMEHAKLTIDDQKIEIARIDGSGKEYPNAIPSGLKMWNNLAVYVPDGKRIAFRASAAVQDKNSSNITPLKEMWQSIERELFAPKTAGKTANTKIAPDINQEVTIYIESQDENISEKFYCRIVDPRFVGKGYIFRSDIVIYRFPDKAPIDLNCFRNEEARPYLLKAQVLDIYDDGTMKFGMKNSIGAQLQKACLDYDKEKYETLVAQLVYYDQSQKLWVGVSEEGYPISMPDPENQYRWLSLVEINKLTYSEAYNNIGGQFAKEIPEDDEEYQDVNKEIFIYDAFCLLMKELSDGKILEEDDITEDAKPGAMLNVEQVKEIMYCLDRIAHIEEDYITSFNYLGVAKTIAKMLNLESSVEYYEGLRRLILILHDFNINDKVNVDELNEIRSANENLFKTNAQLLYQFKLLKIVSLLSDKDAHQELWSYRHAEDNEKKLTELADLVLTHNMLKQYDLDNQAAHVHNHIKRNLRLRERKSDYVDYGSETQEVEFKTSIVYPAGQGMEPDIQAQTKQIVSVVASMMNSTGGKIYIGVNDLGLGIGIENDLRFKGFGYNKDKYLRHIQYQISTQLGKVAGGLVHIEFDPNNKQQDICIITVKPHPDGISYNDEWPVRQGTIRQYLTKEEFEQYNRTARQCAQTTNEVVSVPKESTDRSTSTANRSGNTKKNNLEIQTSQTHSWAYNYSVIELYLNILENGQFICTDRTRGGAALSLEMYPEDEVLVVVYLDGTVVAIPKEKFLEKERNKEYRFFTDKIPVFATFAQREHILVVVYHSRGGTYIQPTPVSKLIEGDLSSLGATTTPQTIDEIISCELAISSQGVELENYTGRTQGLPSTSTLGREIQKQFLEIGISLLEE